jgi:hypothetical protein
MEDKDSLMFIYSVNELKKRKTNIQYQTELDTFIMNRKFLCDIPNQPKDFWNIWNTQNIVKTFDQPDQTTENFSQTTENFSQTPVVLFWKPQ